ncbi:hypothetical protein EJB05_49579, partial [Eragrostis curvula]
QPHELQGQQSKRENGRQRNGSIDDVQLSGLVARGSLYVTLKMLELEGQVASQPWSV